jgi:PleD family two-component response regulator
MNRILAIEPDTDRGVRLRQLLRENLNSDLVLSTSAHAAITAMTETRPDLILTSTLLSANDDQHLVAHLRATPSLRHLPILTIPAVVDAPATEVRSTGLMSRLLRRPQPQVVFPMYDIGAVITRIQEALAQSKIAAAQIEEEAQEAIATAPVVESPDVAEPFTSALLSSGTTKRAQRWSLRICRGCRA